MIKILIVEDDSLLSRLYQKEFSFRQYRTEVASNGLDGLSLVKKFRPDLILLDLAMPKMDGFGVLDKLKSEEGTKNIPVIVLTNLENAAAVERALALGALSYLVKANYELEDVVQKVKQAIK